MPLGLLGKINSCVHKKRVGRPMKTEILILGAGMDPHVQLVTDVLKRDASVQVHLLDFEQQTPFSVDLDAKGVCEITVDGKRVSRGAVIWDRVKILAGTDMYPKGDEESAGFSAREWRALYKLISQMHQGPVINPEGSKGRMLKPLQQMHAAAVGLMTPPSVVTNSKAAAQEFAGYNSTGLILKSLSGGKIKPEGEGERIPYNIMTMRVDGSSLEAADAGELALCPHFFQNEIPKAFELRVAIMGDTVCAFRINSQSYQCTSLDWRNGIPLLSFEPFALPAKVELNLRAFMTRIGFIFGSVDLVVDPDGTYWFLECNEDGQWAWLDKVVNGAISEAVATELRRAATAGAKIAETLEAV